MKARWSWEMMTFSSLRGSPMRALTGLLDDVQRHGCSSRDGGSGACASTRAAVACQVAQPSAGRRQQGGGLGGRGAGAEGGELVAGFPEEVCGVGVAHGGEAAAPAEQGQGALQDL